MSVITRMNVIGLPHFTNKASTLRHLCFIDPMGTTAVDFKFGITYETPLAVFIAKEISKCLVTLFNNYTDSYICKIAIENLINKFKSQTRLNTIIFNVVIDFHHIYSTKELDNLLYDEYKNTIKMYFCNENVSITARYYDLITDYAFMYVNKSEDDYTTNVKNGQLCKKMDIAVTKQYPFENLKYIPFKFIYIDIKDYVDKTSNVVIDNKILTNSIQQIDELFDIMINYELIDYDMRHVYETPRLTYKDDVVYDLNTSYLKKSINSDKTYIKGVVKTPLTIGSKFYNNLLDEYDKEFTLIYFIAALILYYDSDYHIILSHSMRYRGINDDLYNTSLLYEYLHKVITKDSPSISILIS